MRRVIILGSTGSIGTQALEVISKHPDKFQVVGLAAGSNRELLETQRGALGLQETKAVQGSEAATRLVMETDAEVVLNGITGSIGLGPTLAALKSGKTLALANKESLIVGGELVTKIAKPGQIVPVDSEHSAIAQCLRSGQGSEVNKLILTASGGPFRGYSKEQLEGVSPEQALNHPTWVMGQVVTTNSASLVNKGLELIEAHLLFGIPFERIEVTVHPQSVIHSMVEFVDGSVIAQASPPDMKLPIALGLSWPDRLTDVSNPVDWSKSHTWNFEPLDEKVFRSVGLAREVGKLGKSFPAVYNAANEQAVSAFHQKLISFPQIVELIERTVQAHEPESELTIEGVLRAEKWARDRTDGQIAKAC
jgi:1-deoxy-D-xylulose-5-phosphate reductoisomerase